MPLYHATFSELTLGEPIRPKGTTTVYEQAVAEIEKARLPNRPSRSACVFSTDNLAGATKFARMQYPHETNLLRVYVVDMPIFHKAPMSLVHGLHSAILAGEATERLVKEYWEPTGKWQFYEYFGPAFTPLSEAEPATEGAIMVFDSRYLEDGDRVRALRRDA